MWNINQYTASFNANGGSGTAPGQQTGDYGSYITIPDRATLSRVDWAFGGWNTEADGSGTNYAMGASYTVLNDVTFYALWIQGGGTSGDPFLIPSAGALNVVGRGGDFTLSASYRQTANIALASSGITFTPIGDYSTQDSSSSFTGTYDGGNYTIAYLTVSSNTPYQGMFGAVNGDGANTGVVKNVRLINCGVIGRSSSGGIAGYNYYGTIQNCTVTGTVWITGSGGSGTSVGGIVGQNAYGIVENCYTAANIIQGGGLGDAYAGGVAGYNIGTVRNCYATGNVTAGQNLVGGIVGQNGSSSVPGIVQNCYATGNVSGYDTIGGVVGYNYTGSTVQNCAALNQIVKEESPTGTSFGRVAGIGNGTLTNNYADSGMGTGSDKTFTLNGTTDTLNGRDGEGITSTEWNDSNWWTTGGTWSTDSGAFVWDFGTVWVWSVSRQLPILRGIGEQ
jgi:hypothetical protein